MKLKDYLKKHGMSRTKFAEKIGMNRLSMGRYISGKHKIPYVVMLAIEYVTAGEVKREDWDIKT